MNEPRIEIQLAAGARVPEYQTAGSAGADLRARLDAPLTLQPGTRALVSTGIRLCLPEGYEAQIRSRSGLAAGHGVSCLNAPGTIDSDYRGEIKVILHNHGAEAFVVMDGDRIAQMVIAPVVRASFMPVDELPESDRGQGGFGSTGR